MKELSIEEKAKAYDKAFERVKELLSRCTDNRDRRTKVYRVEDIESIFPELKESEDEKIKEDLIQWISEFPDMIWRGHYKKDILAWLEKQELKEIEQKSYGQRKECLDYQFNYAGKGFVAVDNCGDKTIYNPTGRRVAFFPKKPVRDLLTDNHYWATHISPYDVIHLGYKDFPKLKWEDEPIEVKIIISTDSYCQKNCKGFQETSKCFADRDCEAKREAESVDKVEPKFHEGDWITNGNYTWKIVEVEPLNYILQSQDGNIVDDTISYVDEQFHSFTIEDAKDGDVLVTVYDKQPFIYKGCLDPNHPDSPVAYCGIDSEGYFICSCVDKFNHWWTDEKVQPATKEQRDLLFQKMKEDEYEWDEKKKELKKIKMLPTEWSEEDELSCFESALFTAFSDAWQSYLLGEEVNVKQWAKEQSKELLEAAKEELKGHNSAWSEEDKTYLDLINTAIKLYYTDDKGKENPWRNKLLRWLKSIKERIGG